jgi:hypothetical protein
MTERVRERNTKDTRIRIAEREGEREGKETK